MSSFTSLLFQLVVGPQAHIIVDIHGNVAWAAGYTTETAKHMHQRPPGWSIVHTLLLVAVVVGAIAYYVQRARQAPAPRSRMYV